MSQFCLFVGQKPAPEHHPGVVLVDLGQAQALVREVAEALLPPLLRAEAWSPMHEQGDTDELFTEAQRQLQDGAGLSDTRLGRLISAALPSAKRVVLWYAGDWQDLPVVRSTEALWGTLEAGLLSEFCEVHAHYMAPQGSADHLAGSLSP